MPARLRRNVAFSGVVAVVLAVLALAPVASAQAVVPTTPSDPLVDAVPAPGQPFAGAIASTADVVDWCADRIPASPALPRAECLWSKQGDYGQWLMNQSDQSIQRLIARRLGLLAAQGEEPVKLSPDTIDALAEAAGGGSESPGSGTATVALSSASIDELAAAIADALPSGPGGPEEPEYDELIGTLAGLLVGLWSMTRIYRLVIPGG